MDRIILVVAVVFVAGCGRGVDSPRLATKENALSAQPNLSNASGKFTTQGSPEIPFSGGPGQSGFVTVEGVLKGSWLRQQSGKTLGEVSKVTLLDPLRLVVGDRSLALLGETEELEHSLLENSGKTVRLTGQLMTWIEDGRGHQDPQAGYTGAMPAHVIQFLTVTVCEVTLPDAE